MVVFSNPTGHGNKQSRSQDTVLAIAPMGAYIQPRVRAHVLAAVLFILFINCSTVGQSAWADDGSTKAGVPASAAVCAGCHGADGNSVIAENPKLAGQHPEYLEKQLKNYKANVERQNAIMYSIAAGLSDADMKALSLYFARQRNRTSQAVEKGLAEAGRNIYRAGVSAAAVPACAGCHGPAGVGIPFQFPRLAGQHKTYIVSQLKNFRSGARANDPNQMMRSIAARLSDAQMEALGEYVAGLR